jgi:hypothetical protein
MRRLLAPLALASLWLATPDARAAPSPAAADAGRAVVVSIATDVREIDPLKMREAVGRELGTEAIDPDDPRVPQARGRIDIAIDRAARQLVVSYRGAGEPIERRVDLPAEAVGIAREAVLLAGNLARDEAGELVSQLRKKKAADTSPPPPASAPPPVSPAAGLSPEEQQELASEERLGRVLRSYASRDRAVRLWVGWTLFSAGAVTTGVGFTLQHTSPSPLATFLPVYGITAGAAGLEGLLSTSEFESWSTDYDSRSQRGEARPWLREEVEQRWKHRADSERFIRHGVGWAGFGLLLVDGVVSAYALPKASGASQARWEVWSVGLGTIFGLAGVLAFTTDGTVESRLHGYERSIGHAIVLEDVTVGFAPAPGGLTGGLSGRF